ncbi:UNVERIFIED_CONTAM: hypothetical protein Slati_1783300 [Sesamum latifolium]|uniref:Uncharacterized protein n=1 Tax=Sesamum latifolium TaxID=2727402 RepID=A0AAW2WXB5_9LAMI
MSAGFGCTRAVRVMSRVRNLFLAISARARTVGWRGAGSGGVRNDSEETEVAEFLVELPTKTLRMDNPNPARNSLSRRPFRLWTDIPMEERVHVQGVPGGEPGLFSGMKMSPVFGPELWKCTGYVPKKLNFRYTEFPCLSHGKMEETKEEELDKTNGEGNANQADNNAGVLFSFIKENENTLPTPVVDSPGVKSPVEGGGCHEVVSSRQKKLDGQNLDFGCPENSMKKDSISVPIVLHSGKRKKEELKDQNVKKKGDYREEGDIRKRATHSSKAASACDAKHLAFSQDRGSKAVNDDIQCSKDLLGDQLDGLGECATNLASNEHGLESTLRNDVSSDELSRGRNRVDQVPVGSQIFSKTNNGVESSTQLNGSGSTPVKEEVPGDTPKGCGDVGRVTGGISHEEPVALDVDIAGTDAKESRDGQDSDIDEAYSRPNKKIKGELDADDHGRCHVEYPPPNDVKSDSMKAITQYPESSLKVFSEEGKVIETPVITSEASEPKVLDASRSQTLSTRTDKSDESLDTLYQSNREPIGSEGPMGARKRSLGLKHSSEVADDLLKSNGTARSHSTASYQRKAVFSVAKSTSTSGGISSKSSDNRVAATAQNPSIHNRQKELSESNAGTLKENASADTVEHEEKCGRPKKLVKESSKPNSLSKISDSTKLSQTSDSKRLLSDSKDSSIHSSSKAPLVPNVPSNRVSGECASTPQIEGPLNVQNKAAASAVPGKGEKVYQSGSHPSSRGNVTSMNAPAASNIPATLSDEELALLLHQELNSSPRVPRVPRMRHAGSLPQLTCPSATSMLMKRTSSGGKDHGMASRRRTKDFSGEGSHGSLEADNEAKKMERKLSSPDNRRRDSGCPTDLLSRKEADGGPVKSVQSMKKTNVSSSYHHPVIPMDTIYYLVAPHQGTPLMMIHGWLGV